MLLRHNNKGSMAIEYAITLPFLLLLICGSVEYGGIMFAQATLDQAITEAAREGSTQQSNPNWATQSNGCSGNPNGQCTNSADQILFARMAGIPQAPADLSQGGYGSSAGLFSYVIQGPDFANQGRSLPGDWVQYGANWAWPILTPFLGTFIGHGAPFASTSNNSDVYWLSSQITVQNETCSSNSLPCIVQ